MKSNEVHETIAQQLHHMKPADLTPGVDVGMTAIDATTLAVIFPRDDRRVDVRYDRGPDTYTVTEMIRAGECWLAADPRSDVYCDQLGELVFGENAKPWTAPLVVVTDGDGNEIERI
jgi:hypothetical protein